MASRPISTTCRLSHCHLSLLIASAPRGSPQSYERRQACLREDPRHGCTRTRMRGYARYIKLSGLQSRTQGHVVATIRVARRVSLRRQAASQTAILRCKMLQAALLAKPGATVDSSFVRHGQRNRTTTLCPTGGLETSHGNSEKSPGQPGESQRLTPGIGTSSGKQKGNSKGREGSWESRANMCEYKSDCLVELFCSQAKATLILEVAAACHVPRP